MAWVQAKGGALRRCSFSLGVIPPQGKPPARRVVMILDSK